MRLLVGLLFAFSGAMYAQSHLATVSGSVVDATAALIPNAALKLTNVETGESWSATTNEQGAYTLPLIKPGKYQLAH